MLSDEAGECSSSSQHSRLNPAPGDGRGGRFANGRAERARSRQPDHRGSRERLDRGGQGPRPGAPSGATADLLVGTEHRSGGRHRRRGGHQVRLWPANYTVSEAGGDREPRSWATTTRPSSARARARPHPAPAAGHGLGGRERRVHDHQHARTGTIKVDQADRARARSGLFDLQVDGATEAAPTPATAAPPPGPRSTPATTRSARAAGTGTNLADYRARSAARARARTVNGTNAGPLTVPVEATTASARSPTRARRARSRSSSRSSPEPRQRPVRPPGQRRDRRPPTPAGNSGTAAPSTVNTGNNTVCETPAPAPDLADYASAIECAGEDRGRQRHHAGPLNVPVEAATPSLHDHQHARDGHDRGRSSRSSPTTDPGLFDLQVNGTTEAADAADNRAPPAR